MCLPQQWYELTGHVGDFLLDNLQIDYVHDYFSRVNEADLLGKIRESEICCI